MSNPPPSVGRAKILVLEGAALRQVLARLLLRPFSALVLVAGFAAVRLHQLGHASDYLPLLLTSVVSFFCLMAYLALAFEPKRRRGLAPMAAALSGMVPYRLSVYLVFYRGLWSLSELTAASFISVVLRSAFFCGLGLVLVDGTYQATEFVRAVDEGTIAVPKRPPRPPETLARLAAWFSADVSEQEKQITRMAPTDACWCGSGSAFQSCHRDRELDVGFQYL